MKRKMLTQENAARKASSKWTVCIVSLSRDCLTAAQLLGISNVPPPNTGGVSQCSPVQQIFEVDLGNLAHQELNQAP